MRKILLVTLLALFVATSAWAAGFTNGGFEDGNFNGWTKDGGGPPSGGFYGAGNYVYSGDPNKSAIVTQGKDYLTNNNLSMVADGKNAARINNEDWDYHFSTLTQTVANYTDTNIYFGWAAVLEEPSNVHPEDAAPNFNIKLTDDTAGDTLYNVSFNVYNAASTGITWKKGLAGGPNDPGSQWYYNDWIVQNLDVSARSGNTFTLTVLASDCGWGGHGGYAYVDGFGSTPPPVPGPDPGQLVTYGLRPAWVSSVSKGA